MSWFKKAGERFEETKRSVLGDPADEPTVPCPACEEPVAESYEYCPHCGEPMDVDEE